MPFSLSPLVAAASFRLSLFVEATLSRSSFVSIIWQIDLSRAIQVYFMFWWKKNFFDMRIMVYCCFRCQNTAIFMRNFVIKTTLIFTESHNSDTSITVLTFMLQMSKCAAGMPIWPQWKRVVETFFVVCFILHWSYYVLTFWHCWKFFPFVSDVRDMNSCIQILLVFNNT